MLDCLAFTSIQPGLFNRMLNRLDATVSINLLISFRSSSIGKVLVSGRRLFVSNFLLVIGYW